VYGRIDGTQGSVELDLNQIVRCCNGFREARDEKAFENTVRTKFNGRQLILENMNNSEYYKKIGTISRSAPSRFCLSKKVRDERGLNDLSSIKYDDLLSLNALWITYTQSVLSKLRTVPLNQIPSDSSMSEYIYSFVIKHLELVGSRIEVTSAKNPQLVGFSGIVCREKENVFEITGANNKVKLLPKDVITIKVYLDNVTYKAGTSFVLFGPDLAGTGRTGSTFRAPKKN